MNDTERTRATLTLMGRVFELEAALRDATRLIGSAAEGAFNNGVTDQTGTMDEGEARAAALHAHLCALLPASPTGEEAP